MKWCFVVALLCASDLPRCGVKEVEHVCVKWDGCVAMG